jgi:hypothetical protein
MVSERYIPKSPLVETGFFLTLVVICLLLSMSLISIELCLGKLGAKHTWFLRNIIGPLKRVFMFNLLIQAQQFGYVYFVLAGF